MAAKSWGHAIRALTADELERARVRLENSKRTYAADIARGQLWPIRWRWCGSPKCQEPHAWIGWYSYVTGRAGRVSQRNVYLCDAHARRFCEQHGLTLPERT